MREYGLDHLDEAHHVGFELVAQLVGADFLDRAHLPVARGAHEGVDGAEAVDGLLDGLLDDGGVGDVEACDQDVAEASEGRIGLGRVAHGGHDVPASRGVLEGGRFAHTCRSTCDQNGLAHAALSWRGLCTHTHY